MKFGMANCKLQELPCDEVIDKEPDNTSPVTYPRFRNPLVAIYE